MSGSDSPVFFSLRRVDAHFGARLQHQEGVFTEDDLHTELDKFLKANEITGLAHSRAVAMGTLACHDT